MVLLQKDRNSNDNNMLSAVSYKEETYYDDLLKS